MQQQNEKQPVPTLQKKQSHQKDKKPPSQITEALTQAGVEIHNTGFASHFDTINSISQALTKLKADKPHIFAANLRYILERFEAV